MCPLFARHRLAIWGVAVSRPWYAPCFLSLHSTGSRFRWPRLGRGSSRCWCAGVDKITGRNFALNAEIIYSPITSAVVALAFLIFLGFSYALLISRIFPFLGIGRIYRVQKLLATLMSLGDTSSAL